MTSDQQPPAQRPDQEPEQQLPLRQRIANQTAHLNELRNVIREDLRDETPSARRMTLGLASRYATVIAEAGPLRSEAHAAMCSAPPASCIGNDPANLRTPLNLPAAGAIADLFAALANGEMIDAQHPAVTTLVREFVTRSELTL